MYVTVKGKRWVTRTPFVIRNFNQIPDWDSLDLRIMSECGTSVRVYRTPSGYGVVYQPLNMQYPMGAELSDYEMQPVRQHKSSWSDEL